MKTINLKKMEIDVCLSPALYPYYKQENDTVIVVDIFRATTTICSMFQNGAASVITVADVESAKSYKSQGYMVGGERDARKIDFADFGNSPFDYKREVVEGKDIVFTTTNGTHAIDIAKESKNVFAGAFSNINALAQKCSEIGERVVVLCAGWKNKVNLEDTLFGGAFTKKLIDTGQFKIGSDSTRIALELWNNAKSDPIKFLSNTEHYKRLAKNGAESDIKFCFEENTASITPRYCKKTKQMRID